MFNPAGFEPVGKKFHVAPPFLFGTNTQCLQFLNCCYLGIDLDSMEGLPHPSVASLVRRVSHFFPSVALPDFQKTVLAQGANCSCTHFCPSAQVFWVLALNILPEGAERKRKVSQFFSVPFQATRRFRVTMSLSAV